MDEIASKWSTFSDVQKSGIATSLAGTRQRENLLTLFENWDLVSKYEQISENAYGTAAKKMEAYSDSVEAAKTRISAAVEKFVIALNASDSLKKFYNGIADLTENFGALATVTSIILAYTNRGSIVTSLSAGVGKLVGTMGRMASYINNQQIANSVIGKGSGSFIANGWNLAMDNAQETYMASVRQSYQQGMSNFIDSMSEVSSDWKTLTKAYMLPLQNTIFGLTEAQREQWVSSINQVTLGQEEAIVAARKLITERDSVMIQALLNGTTQEERNVILQQIAKERVANGQTDALTSAKKDYEIAVRKAASLISSKEGQYLQGQLKDYNEVNPKQAIYEGTGQMIGSMLGASVGTSIGKALTDKLGLSNSAAQVAGTVGGLALGSIGGKAVGGVLAGARITSGGIAAIAALVIGGIASLYFSQENKRKEEAQKIAQEAVEKYTTAANASIDTSKYDELVKRVDSLGNNVSLTDEQYKEFLDTSNKLAESFPNLIVRTDEAGNSFLGLNGKVGTVTDSVNELVDSLQKEADFKLLDSDYFDQIVDEATSSRSDLEKQIKKKKDEARKYMNHASTFKEGGELRQQSLDKAQELLAEANNLQRQLDSMGAIGYSEYRDQVEAVIRRNSTLSESYENLTDEQKQYVDMIKQSMNFDGMSTGEVKAHVTEVMSDAIKNAPEMENAFKAYFELDDSVSPDEFTKVRQNLLQGILNNADFLTEDEKGQLLVKIGFTLVGDTWVDNENPLESIQRDFGVKQSAGKYLSIDNLEQLKTEEIKKIYEWLNKGVLLSDDDMMTVVKMLKANRDLPTDNFDAMGEYIENYTFNYGDLRQKIEDYFISSKYKNSRVTTEFSGYDTQIQSAVSGLRDSVENGDVEISSEEWKTSIDSICSAGLSTLFDYQGQYAEAWMKLYYPEDMEVDGYINTFKELQTALKETGECYEKLSKAQKEQAKNGKLSMSTILDLLTTNQNYINVLDFEKETLTDAAGNEYEHVKAIKLKDNANESMAASELLAAQASAMLTVQQLTEQKATMMTRAETIKKTLAERNATVASYGAANGELANAEAQGDAAEATNTTNTVMAKYAGIIGGIMNMLDALASGNLKGLKTAYATGKAEVEKAIGNVSVKVKSYADKIAKNKDDLDSWMEVYSQFSNEELQTELKSLEGQMGPDGQWIDGQISQTQKTIDVWKYFYQNLNIKDFKGAGKWLKDNGFVNLSDDEKKSVEDLLKALDSLIDKEWEAMEVWDESSQKSTGYTKYFEKKRQSLEALAGYYKAQMASAKTEAERADAEKEYIEYQKAINNLDDEEIEDKYNILELQGASLDKLIAMQKVYIQTSDTEEENIERKKKLLELIHQQIELEREVSEWQRDNNQHFIDRLKGDAYSNPAYDVAMNNQIDAISNEIELTQKNLNKYYNEAVQGYIKSGSSYQDALNLAYTGNSDASKSLRDEMSKYYDLIDNRAELTIQKMEDKADDLNRRLDLMEKQKPDEWFKIGDIDSYYTQRMDLLQNQIALYEDALKDTSDMTDEQIQNIVDSLNEATLSLKQAQIDNLKDQTDLQSKQYDAIVYRINLWKDEIQDAIDAIEKAYEDEIKPIQDINDELERQGKLEDLLAAKKAAAKEKERVFREGIGWVYESPIDKKREAQKNIDDFNRQDKLDDLEKTKDTEVKALEDLSKAWDLYLKELEWDYNEFERINNERILKELMGCETEEEIRERITTDMKKFNQNALENYKNYNTIFQDNLLTPYKNNLVELQKLYEQTAQLVNSINGLWVNDNNFTTPDQLIASSASISELDLSHDYSRDMLVAKDESTFWKLADLRNQKASQLGQDLSGNNPKYRSNEQLYKEWKANNAGLQKSSKLQKNILDKNNNFWDAYNQTDSRLKSDSVGTTDKWVNDMCREYVEYNNQYNTLLNQGMSVNNAELQTLQQQMSNIQDQIAQRMQLSVEEIQTIGAQMVAAQQNVYQQVMSMNERIKSAYASSLASGGGAVSIGGGFSVSSGRADAVSGKDYIQNEDGSYTDLHTGHTTTKKPSGANSENTTSSAFVSENTSGGKGYGTVGNIDNKREEAEAARGPDGKIHVSDIGKKKYANGIENGPVTYTGLAMLHGTPGNPEFVLNSDQAYTLLRNMATTRLPETKKVAGAEGQNTQYIVQGDIVLENTNNPAQFWDDVSKAMSNRHNVTKNR